MYQDSKGLVTCGVGHRIFNQSEALALPWRWDASTLATEQQAIRDYRAILGADAGHVAAFYAGLTTCRLLDADIQALCRADVLVRLKTLRTFLPDLDAYPDGAIAGLADLSYNLGGSFLSTWPKLHAAIVRGDWAEAAKQSHRAPPVSAERNAAIAALFRDAV